MDNYKIYKKKEKIKDFIKFNSLSGSKLNLFQYNPNKYKENEISLHEQFKFKIYAILRNKGFQTLIEPEFKGNLGKPDIIYWNEDLSIVGIIEVVSSESEESIKKKTHNYPIDFELSFIYVNKPLEVQLTI